MRLDRPSSAGCCKSCIQGTCAPRCGTARWTSRHSRCKGSIPEWERRNKAECCQFDRETTQGEADRDRDSALKKRVRPYHLLLVDRWHRGRCNLKEWNGLLGLVWCLKSQDEIKTTRGRERKKLCTCWSSFCQMSDMLQADLRHTGHENLRKTRWQESD